MIAQGDKGNGELLRQCKPAFSNLRAAIRHTAPHFIPRLAQQSMLYAMGAGSDEKLAKSYADSPPSRVFQVVTPPRRRVSKLKKSRATTLSVLEPEEQLDSELDWAYRSTTNAEELSALDPEYSEDSDDGGDHESRSKHQLVAIYQICVVCKII